VKIADKKKQLTDELKTCLIDEWMQFDQSTFNSAISQLRCI